MNLKHICLRGHDKRVTGRYKPQGGRRRGKCAECERERNRRRAAEYRRIKC